MGIDMVDEAVTNREEIIVLREKVASLQRQITALSQAQTTVNAHLQEEINLVWKFIGGLDIDKKRP